MNPRNNHRSSRLIAAAAVAALAPTLARAQAWTWKTNAGQLNWKVASSWTPGSIPVSSGTTVVNFGGSGADSYTAVQNVSNPFLLNRLNFTSDSTGLVMVGGATTNITTATIRLAGLNPTVSHSGAGDVFVNAPISFAADATFDVTGAGRPILLGDLSQTGGAFGLTKTGNGTLVWGYTGTVTASVPGRGIGVGLTGEVKVLAGTILLGNTGGSFLSNESLVTVAAGATFDFNGNGEDLGSIQGAGTVNLGASNAHFGYDDRSTTWAGQLICTDGGRTVDKVGAGTWTITAAQPYAAKTQVTNGAMVLSGAGGSLAESVNYTLLAGTSLTLDNSAGNNDNRLRDASSVFMNGNSTLTLIGAADAPTAETIGAVDLKGLTTITVTAAPGQSARLTSLGLSRNAGAAVLFRGNNLGAAPGPDTANVFFTFAPALVGGGGAAGTTTMSILPYALGDSSPTGLGSSLVTYDPATGVRALDPATEFAPYAAASDLDNVRVAGPAAGLPGKTVNALVVHNPSATPMAVAGAGAAPLVVSSGALLFTGAGPVELGGFAALDFGNVEAIVSVANASPAGATIASPIAGAAGLTKGGAGVLALTAANTYTGGTTINAGTLRVAADANLGDPANALTFNVGTLQLDADLTTARTITVNTGGRATLDTNGHTLTLPAMPTGSGTITKAGVGTLIVPELGTGPALTLSGGTVRLTAAATTGTNARAITLAADPTNTIDTNGFDAVVGAIGGPGGLTKTGAGTLLIQGANSFAGDIAINAGTVKVIGTAGSFFADNVISTLAAGATLDMSDNSEQWGGIAGAGAILTGTVAGVDVNVLGNRDTSFTGAIKGAGDFQKGGTHTLTISGPSTFTGQSRVVAGTLVVDAGVPLNADSPLGNSAVAVVLGDTTGTADATILTGQAGVAIARNVTVRAGSAGVARLGAGQTSGASTFSGNVAMARALEVSAAGAGAEADFTGVLSGAGALTKTGPGVVRLAGANTYAGATTVAAGTLRLDGSASNSASFTVQAGATLEVGATQSLKSLTLTGNGAARIPGGGNATLKVGALSVAAAANLDLGAGALVVDYAPGAASPADAVRQLLLAGRAAGSWDGPGIASSILPSDPAKSLGYAEASAILGAAGGTWRGQPVDGDAVLVRYTLAGDATLDGAVDFNDLVPLAQNYNVLDGQRTWADGDYTYDGNVDFNDLVKLAQNYNSSLPAGAVPGAPASFDADLTAAFATVPEPSTLMVALAAAYGLTRPRRRRTQTPASKGRPRPNEG